MVQFRGPRNRNWRLLRLRTLRSLTVTVGRYTRAPGTYGGHASILIVHLLLYNSPYTNTAGRREQTRGSLLLVSLLTFVDSDVRVIGGASRALPARANQEARGQRVRRSKATCLGGYARASSNFGHECTPFVISPRHLTNASRRYAHCCATSLRPARPHLGDARPRRRSSTVAGLTLVE